MTRGTEPRVNAVENRSLMVPLTRGSDLTLDSILDIIVLRDELHPQRGLDLSGFAIDQTIGPAPSRSTPHGV